MKRYPGNDTGWVTTRHAAAALRVKPRQVRNYITDGELEAKTEGEGVNKRYLVSINSIEQLRKKRQAEGKLPGQHRFSAEQEIAAGQETTELTRELVARLEEAYYELGRAEVRLQLTAQAESTLRETLEREREQTMIAESTLRDSLDRERQRADALQFEASQLRTQLEQARKPWWRRMFGDRDHTEAKSRD